MEHQLFEEDLKKEMAIEDSLDFWRHLKVKEREDIQEIFDLTKSQFKNYGFSK